MQTADNAKAQLLQEDRRRLLEHVIHVSSAAAVAVRALRRSLARCRPCAEAYPGPTPALRCSRAMGADCSFPSAWQWQSPGCWTLWMWQPSCVPCQQLAQANQRHPLSCCRTVRGEHGEAYAPVLWGNQRTQQLQQQEQQPCIQRSLPAQRGSDPTTLELQAAACCLVQTPTPCMHVNPRSLPCTQTYLHAPAGRSHLTARHTAGAAPGEPRTRLAVRHPGCSCHSCTSASVMQK